MIHFAVDAARVPGRGRKSFGAAAKLVKAQNLFFIKLSGFARAKGTEPDGGGLARICRKTVGDFEAAEGIGIGEADEPGHAQMEAPEVGIRVRLPGQFIEDQAGFEPRRNRPVTH